MRRGKRIITPSASEDTAIALDPQGRAIQQLVYRTGEDEEGIRIAALLGPRALVWYSQIEQESFLGEAETQENRVDLSPDISADVTAIELDAFLTNLLVTTATGELLHWQVQDPAAPRFIHTFPVSDTPDVSATILAWLLGGRSLVIGDSAGGVSVWFQVRDEGPPADSPYRKIHIIEPPPRTGHDHEPFRSGQGIYHGGYRRKYSAPPCHVRANVAGVKHRREDSDSDAVICAPRQRDLFH